MNITQVLSLTRRYKAGLAALNKKDNTTKNYVRWAQQIHSGKS